jgi:hypothetical protein
MPSGLGRGERLQVGDQRSEKTEIRASEVRDQKKTRDQKSEIRKKDRGQNHRGQMSELQNKGLGVF